MEELYHLAGAAAAEYGWNCLIFEGPGQWSALIRNPGLVFRPDYERPIKAVIDYALSRPDVDGDKLALIGYSFGGYFAPRAAAFEPRIKACIANSLLFDFEEGGVQSFIPPSRDAMDAADSMFSTSSRNTEALRWFIGHAEWTMGIERPQDLLTAAKSYTLKGLERRIKCPLLTLLGEEEIAGAGHKFVSDTINFVNNLDCDRTFHVFTKLEGAGSHCQMGGVSLAQAVIFDWLNDTLCSERPHAADGKHTVVVPDELIQIVGKYYGDEMVATLKNIQSAK
jgi:pimeloyl-ACP methyl ester carboxylesterase